jgi:membrane-anchored glycerophosphoryl diester phosphodiesterase (GDPDase)
VNFVVKLLLKVVVEWIKAHPDSAFSRFLLKQRGPRTDVARMNRVQRLGSALVFLLWGCLLLSLWLLVGYLTFGLRFLSPDNPLVQVLVFGLALLSACGFLGGLYLLLRMFV